MLFGCLLPGPPRIPIWGNRIVAGFEPVAAPLMYVFAHLKQAVSVRLRLSDGFRSVLPTSMVVRTGHWRIVAPGKGGPFDTAAGGPFPLSFCR